MNDYANSQQRSESIETFCHLRGLVHRCHFIKIEILPIVFLPARMKLGGKGTASSRARSANNGQDSVLAALTDSDYLEELQERLQKESISSLHERLAERKVSRGPGKFPPLEHKTIRFATNQTTQSIGTGQGTGTQAKNGGPTQSFDQTFQEEETGRN